MEAIIIFTNWNSIYLHLNNHRLSWVPLNEPFKIININQDSSFLIINDEINNIAKLSEEILKLSPEKIYILFHRKPNNNLNDENGSVNIIQGLQENLSSYHIKSESCKSEHPNLNTFGKLVEIDNNLENQQQLEIIFNSLRSHLSGDPVLEAKLEILHECLTPEGALTANQINGYSLIANIVESIKIEDKNLIDYLASQSDCFSDNYISKLTVLRKALLGS